MATSWADLRERSVGVWGLGVEGRATVRRLAADGARPAVVVDDIPPADVPDGLRVLVTDEGGLDALLACDVVVKAPGISRHRSEVTTLEADGVEVVGGLGLWLAGVDGARVACITGSKGKSTTTAVAGHLAAGLGVRAVLAGNIGCPPFDPDLDADEPDLWLVETSSYQAADTAVAPRVVAVTSLSPDHLPWHGTVERYYADKLSLCTKPGAEVCVVDGADPGIARHRSALGPHVVEVGADDARPWAAPLGLRGAHNLADAAVAAAVLVELGVDGADDPARLAVAAEGFGGLDSRLRTVAVVDGVELVDDGLSTNVLPTVAAVAAFGPPRRVALLVGGQDRGIDYEPLAAALAAASAHQPLRVWTMPDNGPRIAAVLRAAGVDVAEADDLPPAVEQAHAWARPDGVVLLSPAAPSFGRYRDYRHRGEVFAAAAHRLASRGGPPPLPPTNRV